MADAPARRLGQLAVGTEGAAAALPDAHAALAARATEAAGRLAAAARALTSAREGRGGPGGGGRLAPDADASRVEPELREAVSRVEKLHFHLVEAKVFGREPAELDLPSRVDEALRLAEQLEGMLEETPVGSEAVGSVRGEPTAG